MRFVGDIALDAEVRAIASGAITDGSPVIVNADGTVSGVSSDPDSLGTAVAVYTGSNNTGAVVYDTGQDKILYAYTDASNYGATVVGTVSGSSISFGTPVVFRSSASYYIDATYDSNAGKTGIFWADYGDGEKGKACVATISGTSVSYGSTVTFSSTVTSGSKDSTYDSSENKILLSYRKDPYESEVVAATISGTDISFGSPTSIYGSVFGAMNAIAIQYDSNANKSLVIYKNPSTGYPDSKVVSLSGTTVSLGSATTIFSGAFKAVDTTFDSSNNKIVVGYQYDAGDELTRLVVATISGTSVSYGTAVSTGVGIRSDSVDSLHYNATAQKVVYAGTDQNDSGKSKYTIASVSGTSISIDSTTTVFDSATSPQNASEYDPDSQKSILFYTTNGNANPVARTLTVGAGDNITSENFIGIANAAYADGQKATVKTTGSIARNIPQIASASSSIGTAVVFESANAPFVSATFDSNSNKVVIAYRDKGNSEYGTAVVGTVSGTSVSFGTPVVFESASSRYFSATFDSNANKVVIAYRDDGNSEYGTAIVGTVSGTSISFGSPTVFESATANFISATFDSDENRVVIAYSDDANSSYGTAIVGTVSGTSISFGSATVFENASSNAISATFDSSNNKVVIAYADVGNSTYGTAIVGTVSGTSISFGSASVFESASSQYISATFDSSNNKVVIAYKDEGNSNHGTAIVGTVSSTSISFGSATVFESAGSDHISATFDSNINKIVIAYEDEGNSDYGTVVVGTVSGTSISFGSAEVFESASTNTISATFDSNANKVVIGYKDAGNSNYGTAVAIATAGSPEDLTIGQQYFVQTDGSLDTSADDPSVIAGTAIGASDIIVKG